MAESEACLNQKTSASIINFDEDGTLELLILLFKYKYIFIDVSPSQKGHIKIF